MWGRGQVRVLSMVKMCRNPCHVLHLMVFLSCWDYALWATASASSQQWGCGDLHRVRHAVHTYIFSPASLSQKAPPNNQQRKGRKHDLQFIREMEQGLTPKTSFLLVKQQPNPHSGGIHAIYLKCLHRNTNGERAFCIFFLLLLMQLNIWETRTRGSFLLMARTYSGGVRLKSEERKHLPMREYSGNVNACPMLKPHL